MEVCKIGASLFSVFLIFMLAASVQAYPGTMTRIITPAVVQPGGEVTVSLVVKVSPGERYYLIDETPPSALIIEDTGELIKDTQDHLKIVQLQNAADKTYTYKLKAPDAEGTYEFSGIYQIDGMEQPAGFSGASTITVSSTSAITQMAIAAVILVIIIVAVVAFYMKNQKSK